MRREKLGEFTKFDHDFIIFLWFKNRFLVFVWLGKAIEFVLIDINHFGGISNRLKPEIRRRKLGR